MSSLQRALTWDEQVILKLRPAAREALLALWLALEAERLPLLDSAATLTAAKVSLLPHQIVLTYRIANASPRRFLIADGVGLGKTLEIAMILRELASRGELTRALLIVPAGLVENWRRELNETFHLDFSGTCKSMVAVAGSTSGSSCWASTNTASDPVTWSVWTTAGTNCRPQEPVSLMPRAVAVSP